MRLRIHWIDAKELTPPINGNFVVITRNSYMSWVWCDAFAMEIANWYDYDNAVYSYDGLDIPEARGVKRWLTKNSSDEILAWASPVTKEKLLELMALDEPQSKDRHDRMEQVFKRFSSCGILSTETGEYWEGIIKVPPYSDIEIELEERP